MTNGQANKAFLESVGKLSADAILTEIGNFYDADTHAIYSEVTSDEAYFLFEYIASDMRRLVFKSMKKMNLA